MFLLYKKRSAQDRTASEWNHGMLLFMGKSLETGPWMGLAGRAKRGMAGYDKKIFTVHHHQREN